MYASTLLIYFLVELSIYSSFIFLFHFYSLHFKFIYVKKLVWIVVLVIVCDEIEKPKADVFCFVLYILQLHSTYIFFFYGLSDYHGNGVWSEKRDHSTKRNKTPMQKINCFPFKPEKASTLLISVHPPPPLSLRRGGGGGEANPGVQVFFFYLRCELEK